MKSSSCRWQSGGGCTSYCMFTPCHQVECQCAHPCAAVVLLICQQSPTQPAAIMQERLQLLPRLAILRVRIVTSPGLPHLAVYLLRCLPPTLTCLQYQYGADLHDPPLPGRQLLACKPPHMSVVHYETNNGVTGQSNFRHVVSVPCLQFAAAARPAHVCEGHSTPG